VNVLLKHAGARSTRSYGPVGGADD
jgi:hypothetical protein